LVQPQKNCRICRQQLIEHLVGKTAAEACAQVSIDVRVIERAFHSPRNLNAFGVFLRMSVDDSELIARAKRDPLAFGELYDRYVDRIYNYILYRVGNARDAEDLTSRAFHKALVKLPAYVDRGGPFGAWLYRIAHNLVANWYRDENRYTRIPYESVDAKQEDLAVPGMVGDQLAQQLMSDEVVARAVRRLDPDRQALLILKFNQGLSNAEIAAVLGRTEGAIKSLYHRTLLALREQLEPEAATNSMPVGREN
jgi:RNA polymerase sigma-70 factor (ECF subfamily)